jgi:inosine-uridine nucleoside N-ribohydrolase
MRTGAYVQCIQINRLLPLLLQNLVRKGHILVAIACLTNLASAILTDPSIVRRIVVVWLGGHALHCPDTAEFKWCLHAVRICA